MLHLCKNNARGWGQPLLQPQIISYLSISRLFSFGLDSALLRATTGNRTLIESSTSSSVNRYTIAAMSVPFCYTTCNEGLLGARIVIQRLNELFVFSIHSHHRLLVGRIFFLNTGRMVCKQS